MSGAFSTEGFSADFLLRLPPGSPGREQNQRRKDRLRELVLSFASEDKKTGERALAEAQSAHDKAAAVVNELKSKAAEARAQRQDEEDMLDNGGDSREDLVTSRSELDKEVKALQKQLAAYSDTDPTELERKKKEIEAFKGEAEQYTDEIYAMEGWFKKIGQDEDGMKKMRLGMYGDEVDEEEGMLRELM